MGNIQANLNMFDPAHVRIYTNLLQIQSPKTRVGMIQTLLAGPEYVQSARQAGVYSHMLAYVARVNSGERPAPLPGEVQMQGTTATPQRQQQQQQSTQITAHRSTVAPTTPSSYVAKGRSNEKAMNYFQNCLLVLDLEEEVALTEPALRTAYKKAAVKAHPDKGGSEQEFEAVTRAYAYLIEILRRIQGGRTKEGVVEAPNVLKDSRVTDSKDWEMVTPVKLNPKKLDMNAFNTMFEQTRIPDPDDTGYGDWLKGADAKQNGPNFGGKFNRDVFNKAFEDEARKTAGSALSVLSPEAMILAPGHGVELGRTNSGSYTAPANASMKYTDLKQAYTTDNTFSNQVSGVQVDARSYDTVSAQRKRAPEPLTNREMEGIQAAEKQQVLREEQRKVRAAQEMVQADEYFKRMKQLVLMEGPQSVRKNQR